MLNPSIKYFCLLVVLVNFIFLRGSIAQDLNPISEPSCGVTSVVSLASTRGITIDSERYKKLLELHPRIEASLSEVKFLADSIGVDLQGVKTTLPDLLHMKQACIIHLNKPEHFAVLDGETSDGLRLLEISELTFLSKSEFNRRFDGYALIPINANANPPEVKFDEVDYNAGNVVLRQSINHKFYFKNTGSKPLTVSQEGVSCGCTSVTLGNHPNLKSIIIPPGEVSCVDLEVPAGHLGSIVQSAVIGTSDNDRKRIRLSIRAYVPQDIRVSVDTLFLRSQRGQSVSKSFTLLTPPQVSIKRVESVQPHISVHFSLQSQKTTMKRWEFQVNQDERTPVGESTSNIIIHTSDLIQKEINVQVRSLVRGSIEVEPSHLFLSSPGEGQESLVSLYLRPRQNKNVKFRVKSFKLLSHYSQDEVPAIHVEIHKSLPGADTGIEFLIRVKPMSSKPIQDTLAITTDVLGEEQILVPISVLVSDSITSIPESRRDAEARKADTLPRAEEDPTIKIGSPVFSGRIGYPAPDFSVRDMNGVLRRLRDLKGKKALVLTFFPKCFTGGCANHLSSLRDVYAALQTKDIEVMAVSVDPAEGVKGQKEFADQWELPFPLIPDTERVLSKLYGAVQSEDEVAARMTVFIDKQGVVRWIDTDVHVLTHGADMLAKIHELGLDRRAD